MIRCDKCKADMVEKKKLDEEFDKYRDEFIERLAFSRTWKKEIHKCVKKEKRPSKALSEEELIAMIE